MIDRRQQPTAPTPGRTGRSDARESDAGGGVPTRPAISLPKGGGAIRGIGEKFAANPVTGTGGMTVPITTSDTRLGFGPQLALSYDSGSGNGPFGMGWQLSVGAITRRTDRGLPQYQDASESDVFLLAGGEDLVPMLDTNGQPVVDTGNVPGYVIKRYRPRIEGGFARIEQWTSQAGGDVHWRTLSPDNVLAVYGRDAASRIADPADPRRVFSWLLCESRDDRGNAVIYRYIGEDASGVDLTQPHERGRGAASSPLRTTNRYLKHIHYGNRTPLLDGSGRRPVDLTAQELQDAGWMFKVVFDYGEHDATNPAPDETGGWLCRNDPFSSYRAGFEVRTYRLCQRVLMFHHFPEEAGVGPDCLVRSTDFAYHDLRGVPADRQHGHPVASFLESVTHSGYIRSGATGYTRRSMPPLEFEYSQPVVSSEVRRLDTGSQENLPIGMDGAAYQWVDLDGEGLAGILTDQANAWYYKPNLGDGRLGPLRQLARVPAPGGLTGGRQHLMDLDGNGRLDLVEFDTQSAGFFERTDDEDWANFTPFETVPRVDWQSDDAQLIDLTGDGHADLLITDDQVFTWYPSHAKAGFGEARRLRQSLDEERGPRLVLADGTHTIFLADMSGDGLTDLVRVRNGEVCYWPNLGFGRFGAKVTMSDAPRFDRAEQFDPRRIRLADVDGSGVIDILYLGADGVRLWSNQAGNGWSAPQHLPDLPHLDDHTQVQVADLLGNGTACLVWSSPLPGDARSPVRYVDLMGGVKPHLLVRAANNLGAETRVRYAASTKFYLSDRAAGRPWITRLPFPVHVVERVEQVDHVSRTRFVTRYDYHHGYFDGAEREFRGFAMVEQHDTEVFDDYLAGVAAIDGTQDLDPALFQPPVTTRTWYHTGAYLDRTRILHQLRDEYYLGRADLGEPVLPTDLTDQELPECLRALKGLPLCQEVYSFDGSTRQQHPYTVVEHTYDVTLTQPKGDQRHAVFFTYGCETLTHRYEREPADPRVAHTVNLEVGPYGNVIKSASVVYGRKVVDPTLPVEVSRDQQQLHVTYSESDYTPDLDHLLPVPAYRLRTAYESRDYEITGIAPAAGLFTRAELRLAVGAALNLDYEKPATGGAQKRLLSQSRTVFRDNRLAPLPLGQWDTLGLGHQTYQLAFTPGVVAAYYTGTIAGAAGTVTDADFTAAGYVHFGADANWWISSGVALYPADPAKHFYLPSGGRDPLGLETVVTYDQFDLLPERVRVTQAAWSETRATNDYRVLGPVALVDPNHNRTAVEIDELGLVVASAVMGKEGAGEGDTLADPTTRVEYELFNWMINGKPNYAHTFVREQHGAANPRWQESYVYSNGGGNVVMAKAQAHPGKALLANPDGSVSEVDADPRWIGTGRTVVNNKGNPVKAYEPFFSITHEYEDEQALRTIGSTSIVYYDPLGRAIRTEFADGTLARTEFTPWLQRSYDPNDTVLESRWYVDRGSPDPAGEPEPLIDPARRAAWLAAQHANTPAVTHADSLGRAVYSVADHGNGTTADVRSEADLTGRFTEVFDQQRRLVASGFTTMTGAPIHGESAERSRRWTFPNALGTLVRTWDEFGRVFRVEYDILHRPVSTYVQEPQAPEILFHHVVYGDQHPEALQRNLLGTAHQVFDPAGALRVQALDFTGNPTAVERVLAHDFIGVPDWQPVRGAPDYAAIQAAAAAALDTAEPFVAESSYDALGRPTRVGLPSGTVIEPAYNEANFLSSLRVQIEGQGPFVEFLKDQDYDAKGQRQFARYGNDVVTRYFYDPHTFRLTNLLTAPASTDPTTDSLQDLRYTYDPVGNITQVADAAQQTHFFNNAVVRAEARYAYDPVYRLVTADGREHAGQSNNDIRDHRDIDAVRQLPHVNDAQAVRTYTESYEYDLLGNLLKMRHATSTGVGSWTRHYQYAYTDDPADRTNRLTATSRPGDPDTGPYTATYDYDHYGNMTRLRTPDPGELTWDVLDQLQRVNLGGGGTAHYVYGVDGRRVRKVIERPGGLRVERIYLGALEIYRERLNDAAPRLERHTLHISDGVGRIAQVDVKTVDAGNTDPANPLGTPLIRYQYGNHLGSAVLETDEQGTPISYEEYHPYGTTAYRSGKPTPDLSLKRYRFSGKERDDETGLYCLGARYYAPWLGRWTSTDPAGFADGINLYAYCHNDPVSMTDLSGTQSQDITKFRATGDPETNQRLSHPSAEQARDPAFRSEAARFFREHGYPELKGMPTWDPEKRIWLFPDEMKLAPGAGGDTAPGGAEGDASRQGADAGTGSPATGGGTQTITLKPQAQSGDTNTRAGTAVGGGAVGQSGAGVERFIWEYDFPRQGRPGSRRGQILEWLAGTPWRDNTPDIDKITSTAVQQIKSTEEYTKAKGYREIGNKTRLATRKAADYITANPGTTAGLRPQAVIITRTDAPAGAVNQVRTALNPVRGRDIPAGALEPKLIRGFPGKAGVAAGGLGAVGTGLAAYGLWQDIRHGDAAMSAGDALSTAGGGLELYAIATPGATVAGVSAMSAGLVVGGAGIAIASGISAHRAYQAGDTVGVAAGLIGVAAGLAIMAGVIFGSPLALAAGLGAAIGVGIFHLGRYFEWW